MEFMGATLRKISIRDGVIAALLSLALTAGLAMAFRSSGRDAWQALDATMPVFIGSLASSAGINVVKSPLLMALVAVAAVGIMYAAKIVFGVVGPF